MSEHKECIVEMLKAIHTEQFIKLIYSIVLGAYRREVIGDLERRRNDE